jgi:hypothetical protein
LRGKARYGADMNGKPEHKSYRSFDPGPHGKLHVDWDGEALADKF